MANDIRREHKLHENICFNPQQCGEHSVVMDFDGICVRVQFVPPGCLDDEWTMEQERDRA